MKIKISVAMACYNSAIFLEDAIKSVAIQSYKNWELVIVDDCSTDNSIEKINSLILKYKISRKVKVIRHKKNYGYGKTLKDAIESGTGQLVAIVDSDDALAHENSLKIMFDVHTKNPSASLVYSNYFLCGPDLKPYRVIRSRQLKPGEKYLTDKTYLGNSLKISHLKMFKKKHYDMTEKLDGSLLKNVDKDLVLKLEEVGNFIYVDDPLYLYRRHKNSITSLYKSKPKKYRDEVWKSKLKMIDDARKRRAKIMHQR